MKKEFANFPRPSKYVSGVSRKAIILTDGKEDENPPAVAQVCFVFLPVVFLISLYL